MNTVFLLSKPQLDRATIQQIVDQTQSHKYTGANDIAALSSLFDEIPDALIFLKTVEQELMLFDYGFCIIDRDHITSKLIHFTARMRSVASNTTQSGISLVFIVGSLQEWKQLCIKACNNIDELRPIFNAIIHLFDKEGIGNIFKDYSRKRIQGGAFLLEKK